MAIIEEIDDDDDAGCALEENPGEDGSCALEDNPGECALEDNPGECALEENPDDGCALEDNPEEATGGEALPKLEINPLLTDADDEDDDDDEWEIPFANEEEAALPTSQTLDVRLTRQGEERLGLVLDAANVIVALREGTPAERSAELFVGDTVLAVQGVACSSERRVAQLLRELPDAAVYVFTVRRALDATRGELSESVVDHGPLLTPEEVEKQKQKELELRQKMREEVDALPADHEDKAALQKQLAPQNLTESKYASGRTKLSPAAEKQMKEMWYRQARQEMARRLSAAEMLKDEGNDKFSEGDYEAALEEYEYALNLFDYEMANLCRDQEAAELGDHKRGLSSDDLPRMNAVRVPCLLNMAACHIKLASRKHLTKALECCALVLQAGPPADKRSKAHFRIGQAHFHLENYREAWVALTQAQELNPSSREVRALQAKVSYELKQLKVAERESREGLMSTELNHKQLFQREKLSYAAKLALLRKLLPEAGSKEEAKLVQETCSRDQVEGLLETVAAKGWTNLSGQEQMLFAAVWSAAQPRLGQGVIRDGRDAGVFPPRDEERIFGHNLPQALMSRPFPERLGWLSAGLKTKAKGLALTIWQRGVEDLDHDERRLCEGLELLAVSTHTAPWHQRPLAAGRGGAQLVLSHARMHRWSFIPKPLRVQPAVMGSEMDAAARAALDSWSRRPLSAGEAGIVASSAACWQHALESGWEWTLVLEDDAKVRLDGGALQLLALLPELVASASQQEEQWQLLVLSPWGLEPFYELCDATHIPGLVGDACPSWCRKPKRLGDSGWQRVGPTFHAFGWVYRAPLMRKLVQAYSTEHVPPLNPLDVWVWEVMAKHGMLGCALAPKTPLVDTAETPGGAGSVRQAQGGRLV